MKATPIIELILEPGKLTIYGDDDGAWLELHNGEEGVELPVTIKQLDHLRHSLLLNEAAIRKAEQGKVLS